MNSLLVYSAIVVVALVFGGLLVNVFITRRCGHLLSKLLPNRWTEKDATSIVRLFLLIGWIDIVIPVSVISAIFISMGDQYVRNLVVQWMSGPAIFDNLAIGPSQYHDLPLYWRQALAEIELRTDSNSEALKQFVSQLNLDDLNTLGEVGRYVLRDTLVVASGSDGSITAGTKAMPDLRHLENIGIIESRLTIVRTIHEDSALYGNGYALIFRVPNEKVQFQGMYLTDLGVDLLTTLRQRTSLPYLCHLKRTLAERDQTIEIWSVLDKSPMKRSDNHATALVANISSQCSAIE